MIHETDRHNEDYSASYCPEDNKLRLYTGRVERCTYDAAAVTASKKAKKDAAPTIPTINPTREDAQRLQDKWNAEAAAGGKTQRTVEVKEMTQAEFSSGLKHEYTFIHTVNIGGDKVKLRLKRGGGFYDYHAAYQVIVLTDKPQKPLPAFEEPATQAEPAEPAPVGALF